MKNRQFNDTSPDADLIPSDDNDPGPYEPRTLAERMARFDAEKIEAMKNAPPPAPRAAPAPVERPVFPSLEKPRVCIDCKTEFVGLIGICPDCSESRLEIQKQAKDRARRKVRAAEWCKLCPKDYRYTDWRRPELSKACIDLALNWVPGNPLHSLCLHGPSGFGKTRAAFHILSRLHDSGWGVGALHAGDAWDLGDDIRGLSSACRAIHDDDPKISQGAREALAWGRKCSILLLDDIGKERADGKTLMLSEAVSEAFFSLIEFRVSRQLPTIWTCNSDAETLLARFGQDRGGPLMRRLFDVSHAPIIQ